MTPADKRVMDLLERWLTSIELHLKYAELDETRYRQVQPWPVHERPARWILELAQQKVLQLRTLCKARLGENDPAFSESLELMCFLANLVGAQHIQRFIPLAERARENKAPPADAPIALKPSEAASPASAPESEPASVQVAQTKPAASTRDPSETDRTREMPRLKQANKRAASPSPAPAQAAKASETAARKMANKPQAQAKQPETAKVANPRMNELVVADAVRLLRWGRQWHELADLIARMAERPAPAEVRRILRTHKSSIEAQLAG